MGDVAVNALEVMFPKIVDRDNVPALLETAFQYADEREAAKQRVGLA